MYTHDVICGCPRLPVALEHLHNTFGHETRVNRLVSPTEDNASETVELAKFNGRWGIQGYEANNATLNLGWWPEVVLSDVHNEIDLGVQLDIRGQA